MPDPTPEIAELRRKLDNAKRSAREWRMRFRREQRRAEDAEAAADDVTQLHRVIAEIREKSGVGTAPMLSELADAIRARLKGAADADPR